ncbi:MAG: sigma-54-dependent Fis family transcriptional regulator, partial [Alphaproteobacteria bacterium]|nr:sigma-54-dependent Fis family transcriptional regulator [Alphaproteobacteria bacterium]
TLPPLRDRGEDVLVLAEHFMRKFSARSERTIRAMEPAVRDVFLSYEWPGNVRELENLLERIFILEEDQQILVRHIPPRIMREVNGSDMTADEDAVDAGDADADASPLDFHVRTRAFQRRLIERALAENKGRAAVARALGMSRHALRHQMMKLGME